MGKADVGFLRLKFSKPRISLGLTIYIFTILIVLDCVCDFCSARFAPDHKKQYLVIEVTNNLTGAVFYWDLDKFK